MAAHRLLISAITITMMANAQYQLPNNPSRAQIDHINALLRESATQNSAVPTAQGEVAFKKLGETSYRTEFVNIIIYEDHEGIRNGAGFARNAIREIRDFARDQGTDKHKHGPYGISPTHRHTLQVAETDLLLIDSDIMEFNLLTDPWHAPFPSQTQPILERTKRGFAGDLVKSVVSELPFGQMAWWGLKTIGSSLFGWFTDTEADAAKQQALAQGRTLTEVRKAIGILETNTDRDRKAIRAIVTETADLRSDILLDGFITSISEETARLRNGWARFQAIYDQALKGSLSVRVLSGRDTTQIKDMLSEAAAARNLVVPINSANDFLQCPISFKVTSTGLEIVVHVPAAPQDSLLHVFQYIPLPLPLTNGGVATPKLTNHIIAVSPTHDRFTVLSAYDLIQCKPLGGLLYCPDLNAVRRPTAVGPDDHDLDEGLCLLSLLTHQLADALKRCPVTLSQDPNVVRQLGKGKFLIHAKRDQDAQWDCAQDDLAPANLILNLEGGTSTTVIVKEGCQGITRTHIFANPDNGRSNQWDRASIFETHALDIHDAIANASLPELQEAAERLLGQRDPITLEEALQAQAQVVEEQQTSKMRIMLYGTMGVAGLAALILAWWFGRTTWIAIFGSQEAKDLQAVINGQTATARTLSSLVGGASKTFSPV